MKAILLGSTRGIQRLDSAKSYPTALHRPRRGGTRVLDTILRALRANGIDDVVFVGGYHIEKVVSAYPALRFAYHVGWQTEGDVEALLAAEHELEGEVLISRTNVLYGAPIVKAMLAGDTEIAVCAQHRALPGMHLPSNMGAILAQNGLLLRINEQVSAASANRCFAGLLRSTQSATAGLRRAAATVARSDGTHSIAELLQSLQRSGASIAVVDAPEGWMSVDPEGAHDPFRFGTKAETLARLQPILKCARIPEQLRFTVADWRQSPRDVLERIRSTIGAASLAVRSSAVAEDTSTTSNAGRFESVLGVPREDSEALAAAIETVIRSYTDGISDNPENQVFVQPMISDVAVSGVVFTRDLETRAPYLIINYDSSSSRTDTVTSGGASDLHTRILYKYALTPPEGSPATAIVPAILEIEEVIHDDALDIEFAIDTAGRRHVLQVRPIATPRTIDTPTDEDFDEELNGLRDCVLRLMGRRPHLVGEATVLGTMPDWNPAEMIGTCPRPLALSLYQYLISDHVWADARARIGYRDTFPEPLIISLAGRPYVDTRVSFNSFLPASLSAATGEKLVNHYIARLRENPSLHDKVEFEIAVTCYSFDFDSHALRLSAAGLTGAEIGELRGALLALTADVLAGRVEPIEEQERALALLGERRRRVVDRKLETVNELAAAASHLLEDCRRFGTLPFSILARYAFMAKSLLRSLAATGLLELEEHDMVLRHIPTVATEMATRLGALARGAISREQFLESFGHLRPGTYDILSPTYAERPDLYLATPAGARGPTGADATDAPARVILDRKAATIGRLLERHGFDCGPERFRDFLLRSIATRESSKFEFSKNVSCALDLIARLGKRLRLTREDLSFLPIERLLRLRTESASPSLLLELTQLSGLNRKRHGLGKSIHLPHLLTCPEDTESFELLEWQPNYITSRAVVAPAVDLSADGSSPLDLGGKIVFVQSADPGYDWIFGHAIAGLVTEFGGVASHMAIRAAEFGLPAAIGCGEVLFSRARVARVVELDCAARQIRVVE